VPGWGLGKKGGPGVGERVRIRRASPNPRRSRREKKPREVNNPKVKKSKVRKSIKYIGKSLKRGLKKKYLEHGVGKGKHNRTRQLQGKGAGQRIWD